MWAKFHQDISKTEAGTAISTSLPMLIRNIYTWYYFMRCKLLSTINVPSGRVSWEWDWVWTLIKWLTDSRKEARCIRLAEGRGLGWPSERGLFTECVRECACVCLYVRHVARSNVAFIARKFCIFLLARFFHALHSLFSVCISISVLSLSLLLPLL